jgi:hypothetical protein
VVPVSGANSAPDDDTAGAATETDPNDEKPASENSSFKK